MAGQYTELSGFSKCLQLNSCNLFFFSGFNYLFFEAALIQGMIQVKMVVFSETLLLSHSRVSNVSSKGYLNSGATFCREIQVHLPYYAGPGGLGCTSDNSAPSYIVEEASPHVHQVSGHQLDVLQFDAVLTLSAQRWHRTARAEGPPARLPSASDASRKSRLLPVLVANWL